MKERERGTIVTSARTMVHQRERNSERTPIEAGTFSNSCKMHVRAHVLRKGSRRNLYGTLLRCSRAIKSRHRQNKSGPLLPTYCGESDDSLDPEWVLPTSDWTLFRIIECVPVFFLPHGPRIFFLFPLCHLFSVVILS